MPGLDAAVAAFRATLERLERTAGPAPGMPPADGELGEAAAVYETAPPSELEVDAELGERAALLAVAGHLWRRRLGPLLTTGDLQKLGGRSRQAVHDLVRRGRLLALPSATGNLFPSFQLDPAGRPRPVVAEVLDAFSGAVESPYTVAAWFRTPQALLDDREPAEWLAAGEDPARVVQAARRSAALLRR